MENLKYLDYINNELRQAYEDQKFGISKRRYALEETYKPLTDLLKSKNTTTTNEPDHLINFLDSDELPKTEENLVDIYTPTPIDVNLATNSTVYENRAGLKKVTSALNKPSYHKIGNTPVHISSDNVLRIPGSKKVYSMTPGLMELLIKNTPNSSVIEESDLRAYRSILEQTHAHRRGYVEDGIVEPNPLTENYKKYIKPWAVKRSSSRKKDVRASGVLPFKSGQKTVTNLPVEFVYYNRPEELLDRLVILWGEIRSGNTNINLRNEIANILQELKEGEDK